MSKLPVRRTLRSLPDWRLAGSYGALIHADRRAFAWEWLRRHEPYRRAWSSRACPATRFGLLTYADPDKSLREAKPMWTLELDPGVLASWPARSSRRGADDMFDVRTLRGVVSVEVDPQDIECWLFSDGQWAIRLDIHEGTLLGGPVSLQYRLEGLASAEPSMLSLRRLVALASRGTIPAGLLPQEPRAARWVLELRTADALASGASHSEMALAFFKDAVAHKGWRSENASYRLRIQRLVRAANRLLADPFDGPWFQGKRTK